MTVLIEILLPIIRDKEAAYLDIRKLLTEKFGGVTLHASAPAEGLWKEGATTEKDRIIVVEVMVDELDRDWWQRYRQELEITFEQEEIVIRAIPIDRL